MTIEENAIQVTSLLERALEHADRGAVDSALAIGQAACLLAWRRFPGFYYHPLAEDLAENCSHHVRAPECSKAARPPTIETLHILTEASQIGGHTRLAWRWIDADSRVPAVVITNQRGIRIPPALIDAVQKRGGHIIDLSSRSSSLSKRAAELRTLCERAGAVILHTHPHDIVAPCALNELGVPSALVNHADHVFWAGGRSRRLLINLRESGAALSTSRRDFEFGECLTLPIPLHLDEGPAVQARRQSSSRVEALTVASSYKFATTDGHSYLRVHEELLDQNPELWLTVVGPEPSGEWREAESRTEGRLRAVGRQDRLSDFYERTDIYLDSFPMGSLTSLLDAAARAIPCVSFTASEKPHVMTSDDPALDRLPVHFGELELYRTQVHALVQDRAMRLALGEASADSIRITHTGSGWSQQLDRMYHKLVASPGFPVRTRQLELKMRVADLTPAEVLTMDVHKAGGYDVDPDAALMTQAPHVRLLARLRWLRQLPPSRRTHMIHFIVPAASMARARRLSESFCSLARRARARRSFRTSPHRSADNR